jgi:leader peptidase (prepilin peptidase)/N-methyltransferase
VVPDAAVVAGGLLLGLILGSFGNVVIARVPCGASLWPPRNTCPRCGTTTRSYDNIPVVSWVVLRGRCRACEEAISVEHPLVEIACGLLFAVTGWRFGLTWALPGLLLFVWLLVVVAVIDLHTRRIPNRLTYPLIPALLVLLTTAALLEGTPWVAVRVVVAGLVSFGLLLVMALINPRGMGMGDVKLAAFIGLGLGYVGWWHVWLGLFLGFLGGGVIAALLLARGLRTRKDHIPFGPWLAAGAIVALLIGQPIIDTYLRWVELA